MIIKVQLTNVLIKKISKPSFTCKVNILESYNT